MQSDKNTVMGTIGLGKVVLNSYGAVPISPGTVSNNCTTVLMRPYSYFNSPPGIYVLSSLSTEA